MVVGVRVGFVSWISTAVVACGRSGAVAYLVMLVGLACSSCYIAGCFALICEIIIIIIILIKSLTRVHLLTCW